MKSTLFASTIALVLGSFLLPTSAVVLDQCTLSLATLVSDAGLNACLPMAQFTSLTTQTITPKLVDETAAKFCSLPTCSAASLTLVQNTVKQNCVNNATDPSTAALISGVANLYDPAKEGLCQKVSSTNGTYCVTVLSENAIAYLAKNPSPLGLGILSDAVALEAYLRQVPTDLLCTSCNKAIINPLINYVAKTQSTQNAEILKWTNVIKTQVSSKCGADFVNGAAPPSTGTSKSAGLSAVQSSLVATLLGALISSVVLLL